VCHVSRMASILLNSFLRQSSPELGLQLTRQSEQLRWQPHAAYNGSRLSYSGPRHAGERLGRRATRLWKQGKIPRSTLSYRLHEAAYGALRPHLGLVDILRLPKQHSLVPVPSRCWTRSTRREMLNLTALLSACQLLTDRLRLLLSTRPKLQPWGPRHCVSSQHDWISCACCESITLGFHSYGPLHP